MNILEDSEVTLYIILTLSWAVGMKLLQIYYALIVQIVNETTDFY